jgi:Tol biopolymer transport system component
MAALMSLVTGTRLGPYQVGAQIGAGGMGEVYRATDTNLGRDVAIKVLPAVLSQDAERLARFEREARTLASLNHPNIAIVHGLERSQGTIALVMELVDGATLADRIAVGAIPVEEALRIARQIAEALESAHEQGIVHRDLKPANVKVRPDGTVKVLDFGLAKAIEASADAPARGSAALSLSPTITTPAMTQMGVILGTAAYMSPEQARGAPADRRADVWAFGCVVYEMLTGRAVFDGKTVSDVLAGVLRADPEWGQLPQAIHPRVRSMIERCLARDVRNRYQGIADARVDIETALGDPTGATFNAARTDSAPVSSAIRRWAVSAAIAIVAAALGAAATRALYRPAAAAITAVRFSIPLPSTTLIDAFVEGIPLAASPNGRYIAFITRATTGVSQLWVQPLDAERPQPLQGTEDATAPFWSPDSEWIAFYAGGNLKKIRRTGGEAQTITATRAYGAGGSAWSPNNTILFKSGRFEAPFLAVSAQGGPVSRATQFRDGQDTHIWPSFLPDGKRFVYRAWGGEREGVYLSSLDGGEPRLLLPARRGVDAERGLAYVPGFLLFMRSGALIARRFDEARLEVLEQEFRIVDAIPACCGSWDPWSVSANGVLTYWRSPLGHDSVVRRYARDGSSTTIIDTPARYSGLSLSPDERRVSFTRFLPDGLRDIWIRDLSRDTETRLTFDGDAFSPVWSIDGAQVAFASSRGNVPDVYVSTAVGGGSDQAKRVTELTTAVDTPGSWAPDGRAIVYTSQNTDGQSDVRRVQLPEGKEERLSISGPFNEGYPRISPDGKWLAYVTDASGRPEVWLASYPAGDNRTPVSRGGGLMPEWRMSDGGELYYLSLDQQLMAVSIKTAASSIDVGPPSVIIRVPDLTPNLEWLYRSSYAPSRDGRHFLVEVLAPGVTQPPLQVIIDWPALLQR